MSDCLHWWTIAIADGPTSLGRCRRCHEEREFYNSIQDNGYNGKGQWLSDPLYLRRPGPGAKLPEKHVEL